MVDIVYADSKFYCPSSMYEHDFGQKLRIVGLELSSVVEAHFSVRGCHESILSAGTCVDGVTIIPIPDEMFTHPGGFSVCIYSRKKGEGETTYKFSLCVNKRPDMPVTTLSPSVEDVAYFDGIIARMQELLDEAIEAKKYIVDGLMIDDEPTQGSDNLIKSGGVYNALEEKTDSFKVTITSTYDMEMSDYTNHTADKTLAEIIEAVKTGQYVYAEHRLVLDADHVAVSYLPLIDSSEAYAGDWLIGYATFGDNGVEYYKSSGQWCPRNETITIQSATTQSPERVECISESTVMATSEDISGIEQRMTESYAVTFTDPGSSNSLSHEVTCNRTLSEVLNALAAGKHVYAVIQYSDDGEIQEGTMHLPIIYGEDGVQSGSVSFGELCLEWQSSDQSYNLSPYKYTLYENMALAESWTANIATQTALRRLERNAVVNFKVTISTEIGDETKTHADVSYAQLKEAMNAGKRAYVEVKYYTDVQDESTYSHSIVLPFLYESTEEGNEEIDFGYYWAYDYGQNYDYLEGQAFFASIYSGNGLTFGKKTGMRFAKKSALDALAQEATESFKITVTQDNGAFVADKTYAEALAALKAGKYVYVSYEMLNGFDQVEEKILPHFGGINSPDLSFGNMHVEQNSSTGEYEVHYDTVIIDSGDSVTVINDGGFTVVDASDYQNLVQRVEVLEQNAGIS